MVIIGVIAAITVPTLITKYQKEQTVTRLKKAYSTLAQTTNRAIADNGPISTWEIGEQYNADGAIIFLNKYILPYVSIMKKPTTHDEGNWDNVKYQHNGTSDPYDNYFVRFFLADGTSVTTTISQNSGEKRLVILLDINGEKKPNKMGRDIFAYSYYVRTNNNSKLGKFIPNGISDSSSRENLLSGNSLSCSRQGNYCAALIMADGWRIADDYPW